MKKISKGIITATLVLTLVLGLAGCSKKKDEGTTKKSEKMASVEFPLKETKEFTAFAALNQEYDLADNLVIKETMNDANIKIDFDSVMGADLQEKRNLILSSGSYPDAFIKSGFTANDLNKYGKQGIFIPLEDLIKEYAPNLTARLDEIDGWGYLTTKDGHIYSLPEISRDSPSSPVYWINQRWMKNIGLEEPKNLDELYTVLKAFKDEDANGNGDANDEIPITATDVVNPELLLNYSGITYDSESRLSIIDDKLTYIPTSQKYKDYAKFVTKLYKEGILDKNAFTQKHEQQTAIGRSGDVLGSFFDAGPFLAVGRERDVDYIALTPFDDAKIAIGKPVVEGTVVITDKCENPEVLIAWFDQFYTEEGGILAWMGIEGETWEMNEDGTWKWIVGNGYGDDVETVRSSNTFQGATNHPSVQADFWFDNMSPKMDPEEVKLNHERKKLADKGQRALPAMTYDEEQATTISTLKPDLDSYIQQYIAQVATGKLTLEDSWDDYVKTLNEMGAEQLMEVYSAVYEEAK